MAVEASGSILVIDAQAGIGGAGSGQGELVRINPQTGFRTSLTNFGSGPFQGSNPTSVAVEVNGQILVTDEGHPSTTPFGLLYRIDPQTGARIILSDFNTGANTGREPEGVALEADGQILVVDKHAGPLTRGQLFRIDPQTGARTILSDFGLGTNQGNDPLAVAVVPNHTPPPRLCQKVSTIVTGQPPNPRPPRPPPPPRPSPAPPGPPSPSTPEPTESSRARRYPTPHPLTDTIAPGDQPTITHDDRRASDRDQHVINNNGSTAAPPTHDSPTALPNPPPQSPAHMTLEPGATRHDDAVPDTASLLDRLRRTLTFRQLAPPDPPPT